MLARDLGRASSSHSTPLLLRGGPILRPIEVLPGQAAPRLASASGTSSWRSGLHSSMNTSTSNTPIDNLTTGGDPLRCYLSSVSGIKKLIWFCIAGCGLRSTNGTTMYTLADSLPRPESLTPLDQNHTGSPTDFPPFIIPSGYVSRLCMLFCPDEYALRQGSVDSRREVQRGGGLNRRNTAATHRPPEVLPRAASTR